MTIHGAGGHFGQEDCRLGEQDTWAGTLGSSIWVHYASQRQIQKLPPIQREGMCDFELCL